MNKWNFWPLTSWFNFLTPDYHELTPKVLKSWRRPEVRRCGDKIPNYCWKWAMSPDAPCRNEKFKDFMEKNCRESCGHCCIEKWRRVPGWDKSKSVGSFRHLPLQSPHNPKFWYLWQTLARLKFQVGGQNFFNLAEGGWNSNIRPNYLV